MLPLAVHVAVVAPRGARHQLSRAHADVRLLLVVCAGEAAAVEEGGDGLPDRAVRVQFRGVGFDAVLPFYGIGVLRDLGVVLQCGFQCFAFMAFR